MWFANIFAQYLGDLFVLLMASSAAQKLFNLMQSHVVMFAFVAAALGASFTVILPRASVYVSPWEVRGSSRYMQVVGSVRVNFCAWRNIVVISFFRLWLSSSLDTMDRTFSVKPGGNVCSRVGSFPLKR